MRLRVLVAEDDPVFRALICDIVRQQGYEPLKRGRQSSHCALLLRHGAESCDSGRDDAALRRLGVLKEIRAHSDAPVMMLTALGDERSEITGLAHGADDYLAKPFRYAVFVARLNALLRRTIREQNGALSMGELLLELEKRRAYVAGREVELNNKEFSLLSALMQNRGAVLSREKLLDKVWGYDFEGDARTVDTHIKTLRKKLASCGTMIQTVRGAGYRFEAET